MCTVSFISQGENYWITSNRDEHVSRPSALEPKEVIIGNVKVLFPKDAKAGGTWFALKEDGAVAVLLNGAFVNHTSNGNYAKSRGLVLLDIIASEEPFVFLENMDLFQIEPFTLVFFHKKLLEFRWDGHQKYFKPLDPQENHIWSSATLYRDDVIAHRKHLFEKFIADSNAISHEKIMDFHSNNHSDFENGFIIDRQTGLKTFSVTQVVLHSEQTVMRHLDLRSDKFFQVPFAPNQLMH
ncbi:NRDE family protein [Flagellimonas marinaquae]|uniref:NRDE family protein n=1 Tax=Flagellimonas marinaquae TaxID=254955 RepID=UPI000F8DE293|nr:NRDE family protein [Allomuricauda aquimarina]